MGPSIVLPLLIGAALDANVCLDEPVPPEIARRFAGYLKSLRLHTRCDGETSRVRLEESTLLLVRADGTTQRRTLPWRLDPNEPLRSVARQGRLSELAVMLEALAVQPIAGLLPKRSKPLEQKRRRRRKRRSVPVKIVRTEPIRPTPQPPQVARPPIPPKSRAVTTLARSPAVEQSRYEIGVQSWLRYRTPGVTTAELAAEVDIEGLFVRAAFAPPVTWRFDDRPIRLSAIGATTGYRARIPLGSSFDLTWNAGLTMEALLMSRSDLEGAATHPAYDAGGLGGLGAAYRPLDEVSIALFAEGLVFLTARDVQIPNGPSARMNRWGMRAGVQVAFVFNELTRVEDQSP